MEAFESEHIREEERRFEQAKLARVLKMYAGIRLLRVQSSLEVTPKDAQLNLQKATEDKVIRLTDVTIFPNVRGNQNVETTYGDLEVHVNGFRYRTSDSNLYQDLLFDHIEMSFFRLGDEKMRPLLLFNLKRPYIVGTEETKVIVFHLVKRPDPGLKSLDHHEGYNGGRNQHLKNFHKRLNDRPCVFFELEKEYEYNGILPSKASATFALTSYHLIVLVEEPFLVGTPFIVVPLSDIQFVNLAQLRPEEVDMTVIPQDFKEDNVLEIHSIPLNLVDGIEDRLTRCHVKYFVNSKEPDWKAIVKNIAAFPEEFLLKGGWDKFGLVGRDTLAYYDLVKNAVDLNYSLLNLGWVQR